MDYEYDMFISYKHDRETLAWMKKHFLRMLVHLVGLSLGRDALVFVDETEIPPGASWPTFLGDKLGRSRVLICLWTKNYFNSSWCTRELAHMLARQTELGARSNGHDYGLVIPMVLHDGEDFPMNLRHIQQVDLKQFYNPFMREDSSKAEMLGELIKEKADAVAKAITRAPDWQPRWGQVAADDLFASLYQTDAPVQTEPPKLSAQ